MSKIRINTRALKKAIGTLNKWCEKEGISYSTLRNRICRGTKDPIMEALIRAGVDLNEVFEIDHNL